MQITSRRKGRGQSEDVTLVVEPSDKVGALKERLCLSHGIGTCNLVFVGISLQEHHALASYFLANGVLIYVTDAPRFIASADDVSGSHFEPKPASSGKDDYGVWTTNPR